MSHHHHGKDAENNREFDPQSYFRLLRYVKPYWKRLTLGILAGMLVGGSLFFSLMMIPQLVSVADSGKKSVRSVPHAELTSKVVEAVSRPGLSAEEKAAAVGLLTGAMEKTQTAWENTINIR